MPPDATGQPAPGGDPWAAFGYLVAGVAFYGGIGWVLSEWLNATYWIPVGILVGAGFGLYLVFSRYLLKPDNSPTSATSDSQTPIDKNAGPDEPPA